MRSLAGAQKTTCLLIESRAPLDQFGHSRRAFGHQHLGSGSVNQPISRGNGVFQMKCNVCVAVHRDSNSALRVVRVRFPERLLGDDEDIAVFSQFDCGAQTGHACAHHQIVHRRSQCHNF